MDDDEIPVSEELSVETNSVDSNGKPVYIRTPLPHCPYDFPV